MDKLQSLETAKERLIEVQKLIGLALDKGQLSSIERDLILEKLRRIYDGIVFERGTQGIQEVELARNEPVATPTLPPITEEPRKQQVKERVATKSVESAKEVVEVPRPISKAKEPEIPSGISLESGTRAKPAAEHQSVQGEILADKFKDKRKHVNETIGTPRADVASKLQNKPILDLTKAIGINDKFLYTKELFNGNAELYSSTIEKLNSFSDINEALIYVQEQFNWSENNEAASRLLDLVRRKLLTS